MAQSGSEPRASSGRSNEVAFADKDVPQPELKPLNPHLTPKKLIWEMLVTTPRICVVGLFVIGMAAMPKQPAGPNSLRYIDPKPKMKGRNLNFSNFCKIWKIQDPSSCNVNIPVTSVSGAEGTGIGADGNGGADTTGTGARATPGAKAGAPPIPESASKDPPAAPIKLVPGSILETGSSKMAASSTVQVETDRLASIGVGRVGANTQFDIQNSLIGAADAIGSRLTNAFIGGHDASVINEVGDDPDSSVIGGANSMMVDGYSTLTVAIGNAKYRTYDNSIIEIGRGGFGPGVPSGEKQVYDLLEEKCSEDGIDKARCVNMGRSLLLSMEASKVWITPEAEKDILTNMSANDLEEEITNLQPKSKDYVVVFGFLLALVVLCLEGLPGPAVLIGLALSFAAIGIIEDKAIYKGLMSNTTVLFGSLFVISCALQETMVLERALSPIIGAPGTYVGVIVRIYAPAMILSSVCANGPLCSMFMPLLAVAAEKAGFDARTMFMGLSFAVSLGGLLSPIGAAPNMQIMRRLDANTGEFHERCKALTLKISPDLSPDEVQSKCTLEMSDSRFVLMGLITCVLSGPLLWLACVILAKKYPMLRQPATVKAVADTSDKADGEFATALEDSKAVGDDNDAAKAKEPLLKEDAPPIDDPATKFVCDMVVRKNCVELVGKTFNDSALGFQVGISLVDIFEDRFDYANRKNLSRKDKKVAVHFDQNNKDLVACDEGLRDRVIRVDFYLRLGFKTASQVAKVRKMIAGLDCASLYWPLLGSFRGDRQLHELVIHPKWNASQSSDEALFKDLRCVRIGYMQSRNILLVEAFGGEIEKEITKPNYVAPGADGSFPSITFTDKPEHIHRMHSLHALEAHAHDSEDPNARLINSLSDNHVNADNIEAEMIHKAGHHDADDLDTHDILIANHGITSEEAKEDDAAMGELNADIAAGRGGQGNTQNREGARKQNTVGNQNAENQLAATTQGKMIHRHSLPRKFAPIDKTLVLSVRAIPGSTPPRYGSVADLVRGTIVLSLFISSVILAILAPFKWAKPLKQFQNIHTSFAMTALISIMIGAVTWTQATSSLNPQVLFTFAFADATAEALTCSDATTVLKGYIDSAACGSKLMVVVWLMFVLSVITNFMNNNTTCILFVEVAFLLAESNDIPPKALLVLVIYGSSAAFMTPFGSATNMFVAVPGEYTIGDFVRIGSIFQVLMAVVTIGGVMIWCKMDGMKEF